MGGAKMGVLKWGCQNGGVPKWGCESEGVPPPRHGELECTESGVDSHRLYSIFEQFIQQHFILLSPPPVFKVFLVKILSLLVLFGFFIQKINVLCFFETLS